MYSPRLLTQKFSIVNVDRPQYPFSNRLGVMKGISAMTQSDLSKRTPEEVFTHHVQALGAEDLDGILMDYTDASYLVSPSGALRGKNAIRGFFADLTRAVPQAKWSIKTIYV